MDCVPIRDAIRLKPTIEAIVNARSATIGLTCALARWLLLSFLRLYNKPVTWLP